MLEGMLANLLPKVPEEALQSQLRELRDAVTVWIGDSAEEVESATPVVDASISTAAGEDQ